MATERSVRRYRSISIALTVMVVAATIFITATQDHGATTRPLHPGVAASVTGYGGISLAGLPEPSVIAPASPSAAADLYRRFVALPRTPLPRCAEFARVATVTFSTPNARSRTITVDLCAGIHLVWSNSNGVHESASDPRCTFTAALLTILPVHGVSGTREGLHECRAFNDAVSTPENQA